MYTISYGNGSWECVKCTRCPSGSRISQPCRYDRNTACETCPQETYVTGDASECRTCSRCQPGYYVDKQCSPVQNRVCKPCAVGYFSWKQNALYCQRCKHCRQGEKMRRLCTGRSNSVCSDCDNGKLVIVISNNIAWAPSEDSDQPAHPRSLKSLRRTLNR